MLTVEGLVVQVLTNIQLAIQQINNRIITEKLNILSEYHEHYIAGLSDALEIITNCANNDLTVGNIYYVVMPQDEATNKIVKMRLYKITQKRKMFYSFTTEIDCMKSSNDLTLSNQQSIKMRVFKTQEEAEAHKDIMVWRRELRHPNW